MKTIEVDDQVFAELQERAEPLVDDANTVLRHLLGLDAADNEEQTDPHSPAPRPYGRVLPCAVPFGVIHEGLESLS